MKRVIGFGARRCDTHRATSGGRSAAREFDALATPGPDPDRDLAAADILVHEADGILTTFAGQPLTFSQGNSVHGPLTAAGRERHVSLFELLRARPKEFACLVSVGGNEIA